METEIVLHNLSQFSAHLDSIVMEMEIAFQVLLLFHKFVHQDKQVMVMEIALQFLLFHQFHVQVDGKQMNKVVVFLFYQQLIRQFQYSQHQVAHLDWQQMEMEDVFHAQIFVLLKSHVLWDILVMEMEIAFQFRHLFKIFHQAHQVLAHVKEILMNCNQR